MRDTKEIARRRMAMMLDPTPPVWWWLSFCDAAQPPGSRFSGVAVVMGSNILTATEEARKIGCNPGGEVQGLPFGNDEILPPERFRNRLLTKAEIVECEAERKKLFQRTMS